VYVHTPPITQNLTMSLLYIEIVNLLNELTNHKCFNGEIIDISIPLELVKKEYLLFSVTEFNRIKILDYLCEVLYDLATNKGMYHFDKLAILVWRYKIMTENNKTFSSTIMYLSKNMKLNKCYVNFVEYYGKELDEIINHDLDLLFNYQAIYQLCQSYLQKVVYIHPGTYEYPDKPTRTTTIVETPQYAYLRIASYIHFMVSGSTPIRDSDESIEMFKMIKLTYDYISNHYFTPASPYFFTAGTEKAQFSSCFLTGIYEDSEVGIMKALTQTVFLAQGSGGISVALGNLRGSHGLIQTTMGTTNNSVQTLKHFNMVPESVNQGGRRPASIAIYCEPWNWDIYDFLDMKTETGDQEMKNHKLFMGLWVADLFMEKVLNDEMWYLFSGNCGLFGFCGEEFNRKYNRLVNDGDVIKIKVKARALMAKIIDTILTTGMPYILYKDTCNRKSNQKHLGTINSSNLCTEIIQYSSYDEIAVCTLSSINLSAFVNMETKQFDVVKFKEVLRHILLLLNIVIDINYYNPHVQEAKLSALKHRSVGIGPQGLAEMFCKMDLEFDSLEAKNMNIYISKVMYYTLCEASVELARKDGPYQSFHGSPASQGILQPDMWDNVILEDTEEFNWTKLRTNIIRYGMRNSNLVAYMPTAATSIVFANSESTEPIFALKQTRNGSGGSREVVHKLFMEDVIKQGLFYPELMDDLVTHNGSIANLYTFPDSMKKRYKTSAEINPKILLQYAIDRGPYVCQSQSLNMIVNGKPSAQDVYDWLKAGYKGGLKTGLYYLKMRQGINEFKHTSGGSSKRQKVSNNVEPCEACSS